MKQILFMIIAIHVSVLSQFKIQSGADICSQKKQHRMNLYSNTSSQTSHLHSFDVLNYKLDLDLYKNFGTVSPSLKSFKGSVTITFRADSTLDFIQLDAVNSSLQIDSVRLAGKSFVHLNDIITIQLDSTHTVSDTLKVKAYYQHKDTADGAFFVRTDGMVFTDAESERARFWFPCWDKPSDKATTELLVKVPANVKLGSNGRLADTLRTGDTLLYHWISRDPMATYLISITAKIDYNLDVVYWKKQSNANDSIPIFFYYTSYVSQDGLKNIETKIIPMTNYFSKLFGEHPFEKNGFAEVTKYWGGMENQTLTNIAEGLWDRESVFAHEFAHQWFGDMITCRTWADIWLNEGFATYCETLWYEYTNGYVGYKAMLNTMASFYLSHNPGLPIYSSDWVINKPSDIILFDGAMSYDKSAVVLHMLRYVLGDSVFFSCIHSYATDPQFRFGNATTDDFVKTINSAAKQDLTWFFDEWIKTANHPIYNSEYSLNPFDSTAIVKISQTQKWPGFWKMPIDLTFIFSNGKDTTVKVFNSINGETFTFKFNSKPISMVFDYNDNIGLKVDTTKQVMTVKDHNEQPLHFILEQNYPNPFNPTTTIDYVISKRSFTTLKIFDVLGREVTTLLSEELADGYYSKVWNAANYSSGIYFYILQSGNFKITKKLLLQK